MKKNFKRFAALLMVVAMMFSMVACGSGGGGDELVIGGIGPITGAASTYGVSVKAGAELAAAEINALGGINGVKIRFQWMDDEHDAEKAVSAYEELKDDGMQILLGTVTSGPCTAVVASTARDNMFQLTASASAVECIKGNHAFRVCFSDPNQGIGSADYIADNFAGEKVAVIYNASDIYSSGIYEKFADQAKARGIDVVEEQAFTKASSTDFTSQIAKIKEAGAEIVFLPLYCEEAALILTQAEQAGLDAKFFGCDGLDGIIQQLGADAALAEGVMLLTPFAADAQDEKTQAFTAAYKAAYSGEVPNQFAADGYDAMYIIKAAAEKAGINPEMSVSEICDAMKVAMTGITVDGVTGQMTWSTDGEPAKSPKAMIIRDGKYSAL